MRMLRRTNLGTLGPTALFGMAQIAAAVFLVQRFEPYHTFSSLERVLVIGLVLLLAGAEMIAAASTAEPD